jgi:hypothetical protein
MVLIPHHRNTQSVSTVRRARNSFATAVSLPCSPTIPLSQRRHTAGFIQQFIALEKLRRQYRAHLQVQHPNQLAYTPSTCHDWPAKIRHDDNNDSSPPPLKGCQRCGGLSIHLRQRSHTLAALLHIIPAQTYNWIHTAVHCTGSFASSAMLISTCNASAYKPF